MIYLAGPIDRVDPKSAGEWRKYAARRLCAAIFDPYSAFGKMHNPLDSDMESIQRINTAAIDECNILLVNGVTEGGKVTWLEVEYAIKKGKIVVIYSGSNPYHKHVKRGAHICDSLGDAIDLADKLHRDSPWSYLEEDPVESTHHHNSVLKFMVDRDACGDWEPQLPEPVYGSDVGYDLPCAVSSQVLPSKSTTKVRLAFRVATPPGYWWRLVGRSSTWRNRGLIVHEGTIDGGYRGPIWAGIYNPGEDVIVTRGERLVQCIPQKMANISLKTELVEELPEGDRGDAGFGSSGK